MDERITYHACALNEVTNLCCLTGTLYSIKLQIVFTLLYFLVQNKQISYDNWWALKVLEKARHTVSHCFKLLGHAKLTITKTLGKKKKKKICKCQKLRNKLFYLCIWSCTDIKRKHVLLRCFDGEQVFYLIKWCN